MAKIKFGMMMTDARGKLGGQVFSKNNAGAYIRTKVTPTNPNTSRQAQARALFAAISMQWSTLTDSDRKSFDEAVSDWAKTDVFGDLKNPTGKNLFQRLNNQAQAVGLPAVLTVPAKLEMPNAVVTAADIDLTAGTLTLTGADTSASTQVVVYGTGALSQGVKYVKNRLRQVYAIAGNSYNGSDALDALDAKFGALSAGDNTYIGVKYVLASGQASPMQIIKATVSA